MSDRRLPSELRERTLLLVQSCYSDFGPTLAAEKLRECHGILVSVETLRRWMIDAELWVPRSQRVRRVHQPRHRRSCVGELIQIDGCDHAWFEDRSPKCTLLVYVDDATSRLMELRFVASESHIEATPDSYLSIQCARAHFTLAGNAAEEYPTLPTAAPGKTASVQEPSRWAHDPLRPGRLRDPLLDPRRPRGISQ